MKNLEETQEIYQELLVLLATNVLSEQDDDVEVLTDWLNTNLVTDADVIMYLHAMAGLIPMALEQGILRDVEQGPGYWAVNTDQAARTGDIVAAQIVTAALNEDFDTVTAVIKALMTSDDDQIGDVIMRLLSLMRGALAGAIPRNES